MNPEQGLGQENAAEVRLSEAEISRDLTAGRISLSHLLTHTADELAELLEKLPPGDARLAEMALKTLPAVADALEPLILESDIETESEIQRKPLPNEAQTISMDRVLVLSKRSKLEIDLQETGLSIAELEKKYAEEGAPIEHIYKDHEAYLKAVTTLKDITGDKNWHFFWDLNEEDRNSLISSPDYDAIIALGGDDTLKAIAPYIQNKFIALLHAGGPKSVGALALCGTPDFKNLLKNYQEGNFLVEGWTRLNVELEIPLIDGTIERITAPSAINEIVIYDRDGGLPLRGDTLLNNEHLKAIKGTGFLISTGAGSTGWLNSATPHLYPLGRKFLRTSDKAEFIHRERYRFGENSVELILNDAEKKISDSGIMKPGDELVLVSSSNHDPVISIDSVKRYDFPRGSVARIRIADQKLNVPVVAS